MKNGRKEDKRKAEALVAAIERFFTGEGEKGGDESSASHSEEVDASERVYRLAAQAAQEYRLAGKRVPAHVRAALEATRPDPELDDMKPGGLHDLIGNLVRPMLRPSKRVSHAYRNKRGKLSSTDQDVIDALSEELKEDWTGDDDDR